MSLSIQEGMFVIFGWNCFVIVYLLSVCKKMKIGEEIARAIGSLKLEKTPATKKTDFSNAYYQGHLNFNLYSCSHWK